MSPKEYEGEATVSWTAPASDGGSAISDYIVTSAPGAKMCTTTGATTCVVQGLTAGTSYTFTVVAENHVGDGPASAPSNAVTPTEPINPTSESTSVAVKAFSAKKKLKPNKNKKVVRSVSVTAVGGSAGATAEVKKVQVRCFLKGKQLKGKKKRAACKIKKQVTTSNARVWIKPMCSVGVDASVRVVGQADGADPEDWVRSWRVKNKPKTYCATKGNG